MRPVPAIALVAALSIAGCGGSGKATTTATTPATATAATIAVPPPLLTMRQVQAAPEGSVTRAFMQFWFYVQWGVAPEAAQTYGAQYAAIPGRQVIEGALAENRAAYEHDVPKVMDVKAVPNGSLITVSFASPGEARTDDSFIFGKEGGTWKIVYDTLLLQTVPNYVIEQAMLRLGQTG
ncbi:MAG: hypothetical protein QOG68_424, partial [Solirubrobacteraceae bacterium]|nr:hypothetical protein [Solirubrobacteraceae bacterium]